MSNILDNNFLVIQGWMVNKLNLKGNNLLVYALIYGFSQDGESAFKGGRKYIADWLNTSLPTVDKAIKNLLAQNLILKDTININNINFNNYKVNLQIVKNLYRGSKETLHPLVKNLYRGSKETLHHNIDNNIEYNNIYNNTSIAKEEKIDWQLIFDKYHALAPNLPKINKITPARKKHIKARLNESSLKELFTVFDKANNSDFLTGKKPSLSNPNFKADFDWLIQNTEKYNKILEGKYDNKNVSNNNYISISKNINSKLGVDC